MGVLCRISIVSLLFLSVGLGQGSPDVPPGQEKNSRGMEYYRSVLEKRPGLPEGHFGAGWEAYQARDYAQAEREFGAALQGDDRELRSKALYNLGNTRYRQGQFKESLEAFRKSLELNPGDRDAKHNYELALRLIRRPPSQDQTQSQKDSDQEKDPGDSHDSRQEESRASGEDKSAETADAEAILNALEANDRNLMKRRWKEQESVAPEKDW